MSIPNLRDFFQSILSRTGEPLSKITISNYISKMNKLATLCTNKSFDGNIDFLSNPEHVLKCIASYSGAGKKDMLSPALRILKHLNVNPELISKYQKGMSSFKEDESSMRKKNIAKPENVDSSLSRNTIIELIEKFKPTTVDDLRDKLIMSLYFQNSFVPRNDLNVMKLANSKKKKADLNDEFNYVLVDSGEPKSILMNNYKSNHTYGSVKFPLTAETAKIMKDYIRETGRQNGEFLFGKEYTKNGMLELIKFASNKILKTPLTINLIRQINITHYYRDGVKSIEEDEKDAFRYLHSVYMHKQYYRGNLKGDDD